jgi:outer membrane protein OmpA-like peptidoglycan-associated protein
MRKTIPASLIFVAFFFLFILSSCAHLPTPFLVDSDKDGVPDNYDNRHDFTTPQYYDKCPTSTPMGAKVDLWGCPLDADKDGVPDDLDKCPGTPAGVKVDRDGCPLDSDGDGVPDYLDKCPNTPRGIAVDRDGCPPVVRKAVPQAASAPVPTTRFVLLPDPDGKVGQLDVNTSAGSQKLDKPWESTQAASPDRIPSGPKVMDEKEVRDIFKDALAAQPKPAVYIIHFKSGRAELTDESLQLILEVLEAIKSQKSNHVIVIGHTDTVASVKYNRRLSRLRAKSVADLLVSRGVDRAMIGEFTARKLLINHRMTWLNRIAAEIIVKQVIRLQNPHLRSKTC